MFTVAADATSATCPGCGQVVPVARKVSAAPRLPSKTLPLTSGPGAVLPVADDPMAAAPDPFGDDLPGMVEGEEIDMGFFESSPGPATPPPVPDGIPEVQQMPNQRQPQTPPKTPAAAAADADGVLAKIPLRKVQQDGSKPLPPLLPAEDEIPEAAAMKMPAVEEKKPIRATREASKPPPSILAGPSTPPIKLPDQGIEVTIPMAPVEEVSRRDTSAVQKIAKATGSMMIGGSPPKQAVETQAPSAYKQTGSQQAQPKSSRAFLVIGVVALVGVAAAAVLYFLMGN